MALRRSRCIAPIAIALCLLLIPQVSSLGMPSPGGIIAIHNTNWDQVQVEIRLGPATACDQYAATAVRTLKRGEAWAIVATGTVCWRREASPGATPLAWTAWQTKPIPSAGVSDVIL